MENGRSQPGIQPRAFLKQGDKVPDAPGAPRCDDGDLHPGADLVEHFQVKALPDPVCCAGMCSTGDEILFSNCEDEKERIKLTLKRLDGKFNITERLLLSEKGGYSDIAVDPETREAVVLFERDNKIFCNTVLL